MKNPNTMMRTGMAFLVLASLAKWFLHRTPWLTENAADGVIGFLYGVSIACLLLSLTLRGRRPPAGGGPHHA
jgi:hypothetical protein